MKTLTKTPEVGSVSSGTLIVWDLVKAFAAELHRLDPSNRLIGLYLEYDSGARPRTKYNEQYMWEDLFKALEGLAPSGMYFGAHEGDGSDFGFWYDTEEGV